MPTDRWSDEGWDGDDDLRGLVYRSNLLGADRSIVNFGGGNTSIKIPGKDHLGRAAEMVWIKGSGSDLATIDRLGFAPLRLDEVRHVQDRSNMTDEEMVEYLSHCSLDPGSPRPSIETMLHAFLPFKHVDHTHPEAAIAFCCSRTGPELMRQCFGDEIVWVPYLRPGFALAKLAVEALNKRPDAAGMFLAKHGLVTWGSSGKQSYRRTIDILQRAEEFLESHVDSDAVFGGPVIEPAGPDVARTVMCRMLPFLRGGLSRLLGSDSRFILNWDNGEDVMRFVCARDMAELAETGAACPDHVMYTKFTPLVIDADACRAAISTGETDGLLEAIQTGLASYVESYGHYFSDHESGDMVALDPAPRVVLIPGFGMVTAGRDAWTAANASALYRTAIAVMRWSSANGGYTSLTSREAWDIEYWPLELYKLTLRHPAKELAGRVAVITGGAGAIGSATAARLLSEEAHVVVSDLDGERADAVSNELGASFTSRAMSVRADASSEEEVHALFEQAILAFGGVDIVIPNAGIASAGPIEDMDIQEWDRVHAVLTRGYFLACRAAFRVMKWQGLGGAIVINGSKNGLAAARNAVGYATAKAAEMHMTRCLAEEGGPAGIRVNSVAPDAVIRGSGLWSPEWREERARAYGFEVAEIEEFYRQRNALRITVTAEDVAEAILFLCSTRSAKTTGCVITVDGGLAAAYPR
ncbi:MAG TPA: bifunctional rhamnulose-1-phosphate aldolase/short-chain dehydrogenase [Chloroflexota bacterium]|jgi:rhamnulose-1-phosphate aldolase/alcohol dehydrogenase|nr:bifunctional rhamnulose-1-phosphate aldolase/short-chain dehydrogenase [Chloroflexota bacterium]